LGAGQVNKLKKVYLRGSNDGKFAKLSEEIKRN